MILSRLHIGRVEQLDCLLKDLRRRKPNSRKIWDRRALSSSLRIRDMQRNSLPTRSSHWQERGKLKYFIFSVWWSKGMDELEWVLRNLWWRGIHSRTDCRRHRVWQHLPIWDCEGVNQLQHGWLSLRATWPSLGVGTLVRMFHHSNVRRAGCADQEQERRQQYGCLMLPGECDDGAELQLRAMPMSLYPNPMDRMEQMLCNMWRGGSAEDKRDCPGSSVVVL